MTDNIKLPPMPKPHTQPVFATAANTPSVKAGYELGCYEKTPPLFDGHQLEAYARDAVRLNATVPDGWKLVPVEPTDEMVKVGDQKTWVFPSRECWTAMLSAAPAAPQPTQQDAKPIYQYQLATGGWIDQTRDSYEYNKANGVKGLRIVYEAAPQPAQQPLTDEQAASLAKQLGWDTMPERFPLIVRAVEQAHRIGVKND